MRTKQPPKTEGRVRFYQPSRESLRQHDCHHAASASCSSTAATQSGHAPYDTYDTLYPTSSPGRFMSPMPSCSCFIDFFLKGCRTALLFWGQISWNQCEMQVSVQKWGTKRVTTIFRNVKIVCTLILNPNGDYISGQSGKCQSGLPDGSHIHRTDARSNSWNGSQIGEMARSRFSRSCCTFAVVRCCAKAVF